MLHRSKVRESGKVNYVSIALGEIRVDEVGERGRERRWESETDIVVAVGMVKSNRYRNCSVWLKKDKIDNTQRKSMSQVRSNSPCN